MPASAFKRWAAIFGVWTVLGLLLTVQTISAWPFPVTPEEQDWHYTLIGFMQMGRAWLWGALTPVVFEMRRRIPVRGWIAPVGLLLHATAAVSLSLMILLVRVWYLYLVKSEPFGEAYHPITVFETWANARQITDLLLYAGIVLSGFLIDLWRERMELQRNEARLLNEQHELQLTQELLAKQLVQAELAALRQRLNPHFMFNAMNSVAVLVRKRETGRAVEAISLLSHLLRAVVGTENRELQIPLEQEVDYVRSYLTLEQIRYGERLQVEWTIDDEVRRALVPTFILQPIIENAIKHGTARRASPGWIRIGAARDGHHLRITVFNDPAEAAEIPKPEGYGVGLTSVRRRLETAYGGDFEFTRDTGPAGTTVVLAFPLGGKPAPTPTQSRHEEVQDAHR